MIIPCFTLIYGDLPMIPVIWFITLQNRKTLFCVFFTFKDLYGVKLTWDFWSIIFSPGGTQWTFGAHLERPEGRTRLGGAAQKSGHATHLRSLLDCPIALILSPTDVFCPKNDYIYGPEEFSGGEHHRKTETPKRRLLQRRLEGETPSGSPPEGSPPSPTSSSSSPWPRGSSPPLDYGFVAVAWSISLMFFIVLSAIWAAYHDYGH